MLENYARNLGKRRSAPEGWDNTTDWADSIVSRMKGVIHGAPDLKNKEAGPINMDLLRSMSNGHVPDLSTTSTSSTASQRPLRVEGQIILPEWVQARQQDRHRRVQGHQPHGRRHLAQPGVRGRVPQAVPRPPAGRRCRNDLRRRAGCDVGFPFGSARREVRPQPDRPHAVDHDTTELGAVLLRAGAGVPQDGPVPRRRPRRVPQVSDGDLGSLQHRQLLRRWKRKPVHRLPRLGLVG